MSAAQKDAKTGVEGAKKKKEVKPLTQVRFVETSVGCVSAHASHVW